MLKHKRSPRLEQGWRKFNLNLIVDLILSGLFQVVVTSSKHTTVVQVHHGTERHVPNVLYLNGKREQGYLFISAFASRFHLSVWLSVPG